MAQGPSWYQRFPGKHLLWAISITVAFAAVLGTAGLSYFFVAHMLRTMGGFAATDWVNIGWSLGVGVISFLSYMGSWGMAIFRATHDGTSYSPEQKQDTPVNTPKESWLLWFLRKFGTLFCFLGGIFLGLGGYLGLMTFANAFEIGGLLFWPSIFSGLCMCVVTGFFMQYFLNKNINDLKELSQKTDKESMQDYRVKHHTLIQRAFLGATVFIAVSATLGFAAFKGFATMEAFGDPAIVGEQLVAVTYPMVALCVALMLIVTAISTGLRLYVLAKEAIRECRRENKSLLKVIGDGLKVQLFGGLVYNESKREYVEVKGSIPGFIIGQAMSVLNAVASGYALLIVLGGMAVFSSPWAPAIIAAVFLIFITRYADCAVQNAQSNVESGAIIRTWLVETVCPGIAKGCRWLWSRMTGTSNYDVIPEKQPGSPPKVEHGVVSWIGAPELGAHGAGRSRAATDGQKRIVTSCSPSLVPTLGRLEQSDLYRARSSSNGDNSSSAVRTRSYTDGARPTGSITMFRGGAFHHTPPRTSPTAAASGPLSMNPAGGSSS